MNIKVDLNTPIKDGTEVVFRSPVDCSQVTGLIVYYTENGTIASKEFAFADAHGYNVGDIDHLFAENVAVKVILDVTTGMAFVQNADTNTYLEGRFAETIDKCCPAFTESGSVVACEPVESYPLEVVSKIVPPQNGSGDPSPENVRPIESWSGAKLWRGGKNLLKRPMEFNTSAVPFEECFFLKAGKYYFSVKPRVEGVWRFYVSLYYPDGTVDDTNNPVNPYDGKCFSVYFSSGRWGGPVNTNMTCGFIELVHDSYIAINYGNNETENLFTEAQLEVGSVGTEYEPFVEAEEITIDFGQTVYGGSYNWKTGLLTVDKVKVTLSGNFGADGKQFYTPIAEPALDSDTTYNCICSHYPARTRNQVYSNANTEGYLGCSAANGYVRVVDNARFNGDATAFNAWLAENNIDVVYQLANPKTIQLTPQEILALSGVNTLYTDTGDTTVSGRADTTAIIEKLTNAIIALGGNV